MKHNCIPIVFFWGFLVCSCSYEADKKGNHIPPAPDYASPVYWFGDPSNENNKPIDIFYVYPTLGSDPRNSDDRPLDYTNIEQKEQRDAAYENQRFNQLVYAGDDYNFYAPFYRQITIDVYREARASRLEKSRIAAGDIKDTFQYYMEYYNGGRPFILLGHSQGASILLELLKNGMTDEQFDRMIAAYTIGFEVRQEELDMYPDRLIPAKDSTDVHCIILYNSLTIPDALSPVLSRSIVGINPINWRTDNVSATKEEHLGIALYDVKSETYRLIPFFTGGYLRNHYMICTDVNPQDCYVEDLSDLFPMGNLHLMESFLYAGNLKRNMNTRVNTFLEQQKNKNNEE